MSFPPSSPPRPVSPEFNTPFFRTLIPKESPDFYIPTLDLYVMTHHACSVCKKTIRTTIVNPHKRMVCSYVCYRIAILTMKK